MMHQKRRPEPLELRRLKSKLAEYRQSPCECKNCDKALSQIKFDALHDQEIQVHFIESQNNLCDSSTQANPETIFNDHVFFLNTFSKDVLCPSCFLTMSLLRGGALRVLKDQETQHDLGWSNNKSVLLVDKCTSYTKNNLGFPFSSLNVLSEQPSDSYNMRDITRAKNRSQVKFVDEIVDTKLHYQVEDMGCMCLEMFMDSIRPPFF